LEEDQPNPGVELASGILASREGQPTAVASLARLRICHGGADGRAVGRDVVWQWQPMGDGGDPAGAAIRQPLWEKGRAVPICAEGPVASLTRCL